MKRIKIGSIYKITYPNGKIYIGQDRTDDINYFGSADSFTIARDFSAKQKRDFSVRKQTLCVLRMCTIQQLNQKERDLIEKHDSRNPLKGYNRCQGTARKRCTELAEEA